MRNFSPLFLAVFLFMQGTLRAEAPPRKDDELKRQAADDTNAEELAKVQGKWVRSVNGNLKVVKEHKGSETSLTFLDAAGRVVAAKKSQFRLEQTEKVRIFTFFNNVVTDGPQKGKTDKKPQSYIYRVTGDTFVEVHGLLIGDEVDPLAFTWKRVKE